LVCATGDGVEEVISAAHGRQPLTSHRGYRWEQAISWNEKVVVPTAHGVSVFRFGTQISEDYHELATPESLTSSAANLSEPRILLDWQGVITWLPWEGGKTGGRGAAHYVEPDGESAATRPAGAWTDLTPENAWPEKIVHLVPLLDGTVMTLSLNESGAVQIRY